MDTYATGTFFSYVRFTAVELLFFLLVQVRKKGELWWWSWESEGGRGIKLSFFQNVDAVLCLVNLSVTG